MKRFAPTPPILMGDLRADRAGQLLPRPHRPLGGVEIVTSDFLPAEQPAIQVRDIRLKDGTRLLSDQFLARENAAWVDMYGMKSVYFMVNGQLAMNPAVRDNLRRASEAMDRKLTDIMLGRMP